MTKKKLNTIIWSAIILFIDFALWIIIGLILFNYEDNWDSTKGAYFSLGGMTWIERIAYFAYFGWIALNITLVIWLTLKLIKKYVLKNNKLSC